MNFIDLTNLCVASVGPSFSRAPSLSPDPSFSPGPSFSHEPDFPIPNYPPNPPQSSLAQRPIAALQKSPIANPNIDPKLTSIPVESPKRDGKKPSAATGKPLNPNHNATNIERDTGFTPVEPPPKRCRKDASKVKENRVQDKDKQREKEQRQKKKKLKEFSRNYGKAALLMIDGSANG